jgi:hypothetical protein
MVNLPLSRDSKTDASCRHARLDNVWFNYQSVPGIFVIAASIHDDEGENAGVEWSGCRSPVLRDARTTSVRLRADDGLRPFPGNFRIERCQVVGLICRPAERRGIFWRLAIFLGVAVDLPQYRGQSANIGNIDDVTVDAFHHRFADRAAVWRHDPATASQRLARHETQSSPAKPTAPAGRRSFHKVRPCPIARICRRRLPGSCPIFRKT